MIRSFPLICIFLSTVFRIQAQESPYKTSLKTDGIAIGAGIGLSYLGLTLIKNKEGLSPEEAQALAGNKSRVNGFDRFSAGYYSKRADRDSYYPFYASFAMPVVVTLFNKAERQKAGQVLSLFVETMAVTGTLYTLTAGNVNRTRPYVYGNKISMDEKTKNGARRSFFAGHTAATAAATFFAAKVYQDFNPSATLKPYIWTAAAAIPATVGYLRLRAGMHFLSDNIIGYAIGAASGIMVPQFHKTNKNNHLSLSPVITPNGQQLMVTYTFH
ncbi:phosphatase PAP2 family protein [Pedobacter sp. BS3]|uniref:phosphatase PAP2 family protein n=1 Tax=Pedobacter sp. BS3 TaxID=2567937 RepID=UPI0011EDA566|nr:phosphatase PAP2 family protein [Pedobacter sp. BS3]TZF84582.1 phosphatase PAP2 family protein [Pedobacter sp. BS3]